MPFRDGVFASALALGLAMPGHATAINGTSMLGQAVSTNDTKLVQLADARSYRHCHNMPRRTYCHKAERLPRNWPPNSNTPGRTRQPCWVNKSSCLF